MNRIKKLNINKFRHLNNLNDIKIGEKLTIIAGENGTGKSAILGLIGHIFSYRKRKGIKRILNNKKLETQFSEVFRFSPFKDKGGEHKYSLELEDKTIKKAESRFSKAENRFRIDVGERDEPGKGKLQKPVIYLGLKRLFPLAQENKINLDSQDELTKEEKSLFKKWHNEILVLNDNVTPKHTKSTNKELYSPTTDKYDAYGNSAGQDNIAQIILSILTFKRINEMENDNYMGGLLLIDELDATLYAAAQLNLINVFLKACKDFKIQIVFTTHSTDILQYVFSESRTKFQNNTELVFLYKKRGKVTIIQKIDDIYKILSELRHDIYVHSLEKRKRINTYFEDEEARIFFKNIVRKELLKKIKIQRNCLGGDTYISLIKQKFPEFKKSIVVLDGDKFVKFKRIRNPKILFLPGKTRPENVVYNFLISLEEDDKFWNDSPGGYNYSYFINNKPDNLDDRNVMKKWFNNHLKNWGKNGKKVFDRWKEDNKKIVEKTNNKLEKLIIRIEKQNDKTY